MDIYLLDFTKALYKALNQRVATVAKVMTAKRVEGEAVPCTLYVLIQEESEKNCEEDWREPQGTARGQTFLQLSPKQWFYEHILHGFQK